MKADSSSNAYYNYSAELLSLETKYAWFNEENRKMPDLFVDGNILSPLSDEIEIPNYLREQIQTIRNWYEEMKTFEDDRNLHAK